MSSITPVTHEIHFCTHKVGGRSYNIHIYDGETTTFHRRSRRWSRTNIRALASRHRRLPVAHRFLASTPRNLHHRPPTCDGTRARVCRARRRSKARRLLSTQIRGTCTSRTPPHDAQTSNIAVLAPWTIHRAVRRPQFVILKHVSHRVGAQKRDARRRRRRRSVHAPRVPPTPARFPRARHRGERRHHRVHPQGNRVRFVFGACARRRGAEKRADEQRPTSRPHERRRRRQHRHRRQHALR